MLAMRAPTDCWAHAHAQILEVLHTGFTLVVYLDVEIGEIYTAGTAGPRKLGTLDYPLSRRGHSSVGRALD